MTLYNHSNCITTVYHNVIWLWCLSSLRTAAEWIRVASLCYNIIQNIVGVRLMPSFFIKFKKGAFDVTLSSFYFSVKCKIVLIQAKWALPAQLASLVQFLCLGPNENYSCANLTSRCRRSGNSYVTQTFVQSDYKNGENWWLLILQLETNCKLL